jgi:hypothetical protein
LLYTYVKEVGTCTIFGVHVTRDRRNISPLVMVEGINIYLGTLCLENPQQQLAYLRPKKRLALHNEVHKSTPRRLTLVLCHRECCSQSIGSTRLYRPTMPRGILHSPNKIFCPADRANIRFPLGHRHLRIYLPLQQPRRHLEPGKSLPRSSGCTVLRVCPMSQ